MEDKLLNSVITEIEYTVLKDVLVKPLEPIMITKEILEQVPTGEVDENGYNKYDTVSTEKEVESDWATGVILQMPEDIESTFKVGDIVVYPKKFAKDFDLFKTSQLIKPYDIVAIKK